MAMSQQYGFSGVVWDGVYGDRDPQLAKMLDGCTGTIGCRNRCSLCDTTAECLIRGVLTFGNKSKRLYLCNECKALDFTGNKEYWTLLKEKFQPSLEAS